MKQLESVHASCRRTRIHSRRATSLYGTAALGSHAVNTTGLNAARCQPDWICSLAVHLAKKVPLVLFYLGVCSSPSTHSILYLNIRFA